MKIKDFISELEKIVPLYLQEDYDNCGLIVGDSHLNISSVLICLDSVESVVEEAIERDCNLIIAHHPIIFSGLKKLTFDNYIERTIAKAIKNNIAIYAMHTNLDNIKNGVSFKMASVLGLSNPEILLPKKNFLRKLDVYCPSNAVNEVQSSLFNAGAGDIGRYSNCSFISDGFGTFLPDNNANPHVGEVGKLNVQSEKKIEVIFPVYKESEIISQMKKSHPYEEIAYQVYTINNKYQDIGSGVIGNLEERMKTKDFLEFIQSRFNTGCIRHTKIIGDYIEKVAVCGGSGSFLLRYAKKRGADIFITSDFKYHEFFDSDNDIIVADIGHYESEVFTKEVIYDLLINNFSTFAVQLSNINTNPVNYL